MFIATTGLSSAQKSQSISSKITTFPQEKKQTTYSSFFYSGIEIGGADDGFAFGANLGYQKQISTSKFYWGINLAGAYMDDYDQGFYCVVGPTISYYKKSYNYTNNAFDLKLGVDLGHNSDYFIIGPTVHATYWIKYVGVGVTVHYFTGIEGNYNGGAALARVAYRFKM